MSKKDYDRSIYGTKCVGRIVTAVCHPGSLELVCSWTTPQCESHQVTTLANQNVTLFSGNYFLKTVRDFDLIPKKRARPQHQLSSGTIYTV